MRACPRCGTKLVITNPLGPTCWTEQCPACGYEGGGTVSFVIPEEPELNHEVSGYFRLARLDQYPALRSLLPALASTPSEHIIRALRSNGLRWGVGPLTMREARRYQDQATEHGLEFVIGE